jgi:hypothetical protein
LKRPELKESLLYPDPTARVPALTGPSEADCERLRLRGL